MSNLNRGNLPEEIEKPEKDKVNIYENDEAYMLNDDKDLDLDSANREREEGLNFDGPYEEDFEAEREVLNEEAMLQGETVRKEEEDYAENRSASQLITLKYISVCQCCKNNFNSSLNIPYLLKCGHFFCRTCLMNYFTEEDGRIFCPDDGIVANSIRDLKLLNNLILDRTVDEEATSQRGSGFCEHHPGQKLSHFVEDTREIICVYCAFNKFKKNPKYEIKEIKDKCQEVLHDVERILNDNQHYVETLQDTLKEIKENKSTEEERVANLYDEVIKYLEEKKNEMFDSINSIFANNADKLSEKLDFFSSKMEDAEELKAHIVAVMNSSSNQINEVMQRYTQFMRETNDSNKLNLELVEFKFSHDDENKMIKYLNNFGDLKSKTKHIRFMPKGNENFSVAYSPQDNEDLQFKNMSIQNKKKNYESKVTANNKYPNLFQNEVLNTSELLNDKEEFSGRANTQTNYLSANLNASDYLAKPYNNLLRPPSSSKNL